MAYTNSGWPTNIPAGSDNLNTADDQLRRLRLDLKERFNDIVDDITTDPVVPKQLDIGRIIGTPDLARVYTNAAFSLPTGVNKVIDFVAETLDTGSFHDNSVNPSRLTITTAAYYQIRTVIHALSGSTAAIGTLEIRKNGSAIAGFSLSHPGSTVSVGFIVSIIDLAAASDIYTAVFTQASGQNWATGTGAAENFFEIVRLAGTT